MGQDTGSEEYFGLSNSVEVSVEFQGGDHVLASFFPIHKSLGYDIRREEFVALSELLERNPEKKEKKYVINIFCIENFPNQL